MFLRDHHWYSFTISFKNWTIRKADAVCDNLMIEFLACKTHTFSRIYANVSAQHFPEHKCKKVKYSSKPKSPKLQRGLRVGVRTDDTASVLTFRWSCGNLIQTKTNPCKTNQVDDVSLIRERTLSQLNWRNSA